MHAFVLWWIRIYQKWLSLLKGYCCAYRGHTGRASCSIFSYRAVEWHGIPIGLRSFVDGYGALPSVALNDTAVGTREGKMVAGDRIELSTLRFSVACSTN